MVTAAEVTEISVNTVASMPTVAMDTVAEMPAVGVDAVAATSSGAMEDIVDAVATVGVDTDDVAVPAVATNAAAEVPAAGSKEFAQSVERFCAGCNVVKACSEVRGRGAHFCYDCWATWHEHEKKTIASAGVDAVVPTSSAAMEDIVDRVATLGGDTDAAVPAVVTNTATEVPAAEAPPPPPPLGFDIVELRKRRSDVCFELARKGTCVFGEGCYFSHDLTTNGSMSSKRHDNGKTKTKFIFTDDYACCNLGEPCIRHPPKKYDSGRLTSMCATFVKTGECAAGWSCADAHSVHTLWTPEESKKTPGYKRMLCTYHCSDDLKCEFENRHECFDAHGEFDLRRPKKFSPFSCGIECGTSLTVKWDDSLVWKSTTVWECVGKLAKGTVITAAGPPERVDGFSILPINPEGAMELRYVEAATKPEDRVFEFIDAHLHLDQVILSRMYGSWWHYKTLMCKLDNCFFGESCAWAHKEAELRIRPKFNKSDLVGFIEGIDVAPGKFSGCVHSCCGSETIDETVRLVEWGREALGGRIYASFGIHPSSYHQYTPEVEAKLEAALDVCGAQGIAWGECGLDYNKRAHDIKRDESIRLLMQDVFTKQALVAARRKLPLIVHSRDAVSDCFTILRKTVPSDHHVHLHSFMGTPDQLTEFLEGWPNGYIGFTGAINWAISERPGGLQYLAKVVPLDRFLLETDGPFMAPLPFRGEESHPGFIPWVAEGVALSRGMTTAKVLEAANTNFRRFYNMPQ